MQSPTCISRFLVSRLARLMAIVVLSASGGGAVHTWFYDSVSFGDLFSCNGANRDRGRGSMPVRVMIT